VLEHAGGTALSDLLWCLRSRGPDGSGVGAGSGAGEDAEAAKREQRRRDELKRVAGRWAGALPAGERLPLAEQLMQAAGDSPGDPAIVLLLNAWSGWLGEAPCLAAVLRRTAGMLAAQGGASTTAAAEDNGKLSGGAVLRRLMPLLVLKVPAQLEEMMVLPLGALGDTTNADLYRQGGGGESKDAGGEAGAPSLSISDALLRQMVDASEVDNVRRLSAELAGRLDPGFVKAHCARLLASPACAGPSPDLRLLRTVCFVWCAMLAAWGAPVAPEHRHPTAASDGIGGTGGGGSCRGAPGCGCDGCTTALLVRRLLAVLRAQRGGEELRKSQLGAMDCLAMLAWAELRRRPAAAEGSCEGQRRPRIVELPVEGVEEDVEPSGVGKEAPKTAVLGGMMDILLGEDGASLDGPFWRVAADNEEAEAEAAGGGMQLRICMANALIMLSRHVEGGRLEAAFGAAVLPRVAAALRGMLTPGGAPTPVAAAALQVLFTGTHKVGKALVSLDGGRCVTDMMAIAALGLEDAQPAEVRLAAARLLAALLALDGLDAVNGAPAAVDGLAAALSRAAFLDTSPEVRSVCEQLLGCL